MCYPLFLGQLFSLFLSPCESKQSLSRVFPFWSKILMFLGWQHLGFSRSHTIWGPESPLGVMEGLSYHSTSCIPMSGSVSPSFWMDRVSLPSLSQSIGLKKGGNIKSQRRGHQRRDSLLSSLQWETETSSATLLIPLSFSDPSQHAPLLHSCFLTSGNKLSYALKKSLKVWDLLVSVAGCWQWAEHCLCITWLAALPVPNNSVFLAGIPVAAPPRSYSWDIWREA